MKSRLSLFQVLALAALFLSVVSGDRRGGVEKRSPQSASFSAQEQALFGTCTAEDCVLGPAQGSSYFQQAGHAEMDEVVSVSSIQPQQPNQKSSEDSNADTKQSRGKAVQEETGFGRPPTFVLHH